MTDDELQEDDELQREAELPDYNDKDDADDDRNGPCIGADCVFPHPDHRRDECATVEMMEAWAKEGADAEAIARLKASPFMNLLENYIPKESPRLHRWGQRQDGSFFEEPPRLDPTIAAAVEAFANYPIKDK